MALVFLSSCASWAWCSACTPSRPREGERASPALDIPPLGPDAAGAAREETGASAEEIGALEPSSNVDITARDPRLASRKPRSRARILTEAQVLERLLGTTRKDATDRPDILLRLAGAYADLASTAAGGDAATSRKESIKYYAALVTDHPSSSRIDEALYYLALGHELSGDLKSARASYFELIQRAPSSKFVPLAYFAFGEMFFMEGASDASKNDSALQAYQEVLKYPASQNAVYGEALYRMGRVYLRQGNAPKAADVWTRLRRELPDSSAATRATPEP